jgi:hypothetical protein
VISKPEEGGGLGPCWVVAPWAREERGLTTLVTINNFLLFCDAPSTCFGCYRLSSGRSFAKEYISNKWLSKMFIVESKIHSQLKHH